MTTPPEKRLRGFALVSAIFLLVALAALGAFAVNVSTTLHVGSALDLLGTRAYYAARAGTEWGAARIVGDAGFCAANPSSDLGSINGIRVTVVCATRAEGGGDEAGLGKIQEITSTACTHPLGGVCPGTASATNYVERQIVVLVERAP